MSSPKNPYQNFSRYILRAPLFSIEFYKSFTQGNAIDEDKIKKLCKDDRIKEAIFLASPILHSEIEKWIAGKLDQEKSNKILISVVKYLSRMSSRSTPFGLFAGTSVGKFSDNTLIKLKQNYNHKRHTRFDMNYLVSLSQTLTKVESIRNQLIFHPNTSIYKVGHQLRYVEYSYEGSKRVHHIVGVNYSKHLKKVLKKAEKGKTIEQLTNYLISDSVSFDEALGFIIELVENQVLISELEPSVSGKDFLSHIISSLKKLEHAEVIIRILKKLKNLLVDIDNSIGNNISRYEEVGEILKTLQTDFEIKYLFQTDMILSNEENSLHHSIPKKMLGAFNLLNKLSPVQSESSILKFKNSFFERYETKPMALSKVLDKELGIGFEQDQYHGDVNTLVDDLNLPNNNKASSDYKITTNPIQDILQEKLIECIESKSELLIFTDDDFADFKTDWSDLPDTMSAMAEVFYLDDKEKIFMPFLTGSSAANLLGRFCHSDHNTMSLVEEIIAVEKQINQDKIIAEIVHLPESRVGNILFRPHLRDYEIPYLANSTLNKKNQIKIDDLEIVAQNPNELTIRSKRHNKEVMTRLSNAHNFTVGSLPVYQFLASAQNINKRNSLGFNWGLLENKFSMLPRVEYKDIILSPKLWNFKKLHINKLLDNPLSDSELLDAINKFKTQKKLPNLVMLKDGDNELLINLESLLSVRMFLSTIKNRKSFQLKEFFHSKKSIVKESSNSHSSQLVISFFNNEKLKKTS